MKSQILFFILSLALAAGCAATSKPDDPAILLGEKPHFESMNSFQRLVKTTPGSENYERARIDYLLERISASPYHFIRNDTEYSTARAVMHLRWKYLRHRRDAPNAEAFVNRIATGSKITGREYLIRKSEAEVYPLNSVLRHELSLLSEGLREYEQAVKESAQTAEVMSHNV